MESFDITTQWVFSHGYFFMFLGMLIWGPAVTAAGAFGAALHSFNIWIVFVLSLTSNLLGDIIFYALGYWGHEEIALRYGKYVGITKPRLRIFQELITENLGKAMTIAKLIPLLALPGLVMAGVAKAPLRPYIWWALIIALPSTLAYLALGYYFGTAYDIVERYFHLGGIVIAILIFIFFVSVYISRRMSRQMERKHEK